MSSATAARYMTRFQCLGPECEDHCCGGWAIPIDHDHYKRLGGAMSGSDEERRRFKELVQLKPPNQRSKRSYAILAQTPPGRCALLDPSGWCSLQQRFGESMLPDACASYPRAISEIRGHLELFADLSCPETARLCLLADDALELDEVDPGRLGRLVLRQRLTDSPPDPYLLRFTELRAAFRDLLTDERFALPSRLFFLAFLAHRLGPDFVRGTRRFDAEAFTGELAAFRRLENRQQLDGLVRGARIENSVAPAIVFTVLHGLAEGGAPAPGVRMISEALAVRDAEGNEATLSPAGSALRMARYGERTAALPSDLAARFDLALRNYAINFWMKDWYVHVTSLVLHVQRFLVRVAMTRYLVALHPDLPAAIAAADEAERRARFDKLVVQTVYRLARLFDTAPGYAAALRRALEATNMLGVPHSIALIRF